MTFKKIITLTLMMCATYTWADNSNSTTSSTKIASNGTAEAASTTGLNSGDDTRNGFARVQSLNGVQAIVYSLVVAGAVTWVSYETYKNATGKEPSSSPTGTIP